MNLDENGFPREMPPTWFRFALLAMLALHLFDGLSGPRILPAPWHQAGIGLVLLGGGLILWAARLFQGAGTGIRPFRSLTRLVVHGPYRFTRNPMYLGMVLVLVGTAAWCRDLTPWFVVPVFVVVIDRRFIAREERFLADRLGDSYREYCQRVRRWL